MKRGINVFFIFVILLLILVSAVIIGAAIPGDANDDGKLDDKELEELLNSNPKFLSSILNDDKKLEAFMKALKTSGNEDKLIDLWIEKKDGESVLGDGAKNKIWQYVSKSGDSDSNKYLKKIADRLIKKTYEGMKVGNKEAGIDAVNIKNPEKLEWQGNKLGMKKDGEFNLWLDLEKMPIWLKEISFEDDKFNLKFDTGRVIKNVKLSGGTIGENGQIIGPNGKIIGTYMNENLKSIVFDSQKKEFTVTFDFKGEDKTLILGLEDVNPEKRELINNILNDPNLKKYADKILSNVNGLGIDYRYGGTGLPVQDMLNVLYGEGNVEETIEISFDEYGDPKVDLSHGGTLVTTDPKGVVKNYYNQWYSENGVATGLDSNGVEPGIFLFEANGEIRAAQNGVVSVMGMGSAYVSRKELVGVDIVKNSFVEALARGDSGAVLEAVYKKGADIIDIDALKDQFLTNGKLDLEGIQTQLIELLREELDNPNLKTEMKNKIQDGLDAVIANYEKSSENLLDYFVGENIEDSRIREGISETKERAANKLLTALLSDPQKTKNLLEFKDKDETNEFIRTLLRRAISDEALGSDLISSVNNQLNKDAEFGKKFREEIKKIFGVGADENINTAKYQSYINKIIEETDFYEDIHSEQNLRTTLISRFDENDVSTEDQENLVSIVTALVEDAKSKVISERERIQRDLLSDMSDGKETAYGGKDKYSNKVVIDTYFREVYAFGNRAIAFDAKTPLNQFTATSTRTGSDNPLDTIQLWSGGNPIAVFDGAQTSTSRIVRNYPYASINKIVNTQDSANHYLKLEKRGWNGYSLHDPQQLVRSSQYITTGLIRANPFVGISISKPIDEDIGSNSESKIVLFDSIDQITGIFGGRLKRRLINRFMPEGYIAGLISQRLSQYIDPGYDRVVERFGGQDNLDNGLNMANQFFKFAAENGASAPQAITDAAFVVQHRESIKTLLNFMQQSSSGNRHNDITITPSYFEVSGQKITHFTDKNGNQQSLTPTLRTLMRGFDIGTSDPELNPFRHYTIRELIQLKRRMG